MKIITMPVLILSLSGCVTMSGFVNQETIEYNESANMSVKSELVTYVVNVDEILKVYGKEKSNNASLRLDSKKLAADLDIDIVTAEKLVMIAEDLDQINSQNYPILFTIFLGLNANPSNEENRKKFWTSLDLLIKRTYDARDKELALKNRNVSLQPQSLAKK